MAGFLVGVAVLRLDRVGMALMLIGCLRCLSSGSRHLCGAAQDIVLRHENGGAKFDHGSGGIDPLRAA